MTVREEHYSAAQYPSATAPIPPQDWQQERLERPISLKPKWLVHALAKMALAIKTSAAVPWLKPALAFKKLPAWPWLKPALAQRLNKFVPWLKPALTLKN